MSTFTIKTSEAVTYSLDEIMFFALDGNRRGIINGLQFSRSCVIYRVLWNDMVERWHFESELAKERPVT
jgi:hypothetical protein